ncbi:hypothetical protein BTA51_25320 [Hahella sp. CCB-MM4]|uniref:substrate-binding periplasmic protein n=1 Tax=Hahella sp. (strain CCB-MM4) TaxID=1926491 RepID=UPI000B9A395D|nr:transporter substrate-binding domain-containing protein [Hahella sp. CCB-MM4]OZG70685.1 hypothetical protein BTA51_25320 [Hahella sp. CCB-MM4]
MHARQYQRTFIRSKKSPSLIILLITTIWLYLISHSASADDTLKFVMQDSAPKYLVQNNRISGLCGDIYMALKSRLEEKGIKVVIFKEKLPINRILMMLETGASDAYCGAGRNPRREQLFVYSALPVYSVSNVVAAHKNESFNPGNFEELAASKALVGALLGTSSAAYLKQQKDVIVDDHFHSLDNALEVLAKNQYVRFFYYHDLGLNYLVPRSGLPLRVVPTKFRSTPQWFIYSKLTPEHLRVVLDDEITQMTDSGALSQVTQPYLN